MNFSWLRSHVRSSLSRAIVASLLVFAGLSAPRAHADSATLNGVTLTLNTTNLTVTEPGQLVVSYTVENNSGSPISVFPLTGGQAFVSGDTSDSIVIPFFIDRGTCDASLASGAAPCTFTVTFPTSADTGETDGDSGIEAFTFTLPSGVSLTDNITVMDPTPTPEPSSLVLLGCGLAGLLGFGLLRRFASA